MSEYPNFCPKRDAGHDTDYPRYLIVNEDGSPTTFFPVVMNPTVKDEHGNVLFKDGSVWWPCKYCGLVFWEPLEVAKRKAVEEREGKS